MSTNAEFFIGSREQAPRPCAFYQAAMASAAHLARGGEGCAPAGLSHSCMLNPGRSCGPDGEEIGPIACTPARQAACQAHRRKRIARLHATLPDPRHRESAPV
jgi:hypothetical protein